MSKLGPCRVGLPNCGTPTAWWTSGNGAYTRLCKKCLDLWFDNADDDDSLEPTAWGWLNPPTPSAEQLAAALRDPSNRSVVREILRSEARHGAPWLVEFIDRENRARRPVRT